jgi:nitrogen fixation NifU-like protein
VNDPVNGDLRDLYQEVILDHNRHPRNFRVLPEANCTAEGYNPLCGDRVEVYLRVEDERVQEVSFQGSGCAISTASASLMTEALRGKTVAEAHDLFHGFHDMVVRGVTRETGTDALDQLAVFSGVREFPIRVKCATLAWHAVEAALNRREQPVSTE